MVGHNKDFISFCHMLNYSYHNSKWLPHSRYVILKGYIHHNFYDIYDNVNFQNISVRKVLLEILVCSNLFCFIPLQLINLLAVLQANVHGKT